MKNNTKKGNAGLIALIIILFLALIGMSVWILFFNGNTVNIFGNKQPEANEKEGNKVNTQKIVSESTINQYLDHR